MPETATPATTAQSQRFQIKRMPLEDGDAGIARTIQLMQQIVAGNEGAPNGDVRRKALQIISDVPSGDRLNERNAIFNWVKQNIKFRGEYQETLQSPIVTMQMGAGDCDDHSTLMAALLQSVGHETAFKTVGTDGNRDFSHVYNVWHDPKSGAWVPLDTTVPSSFPGWESPRISRAKTWNAGGMSGLGAYRSRMRGLSGLGAYRRSTKKLGDASDVNNIVRQFDPLINAAAVRLAYGSNAGNQPFTQTFGSGTPSWVPWVLGFGALALLMNSAKGRR